MNDNPYRKPADSLSDRLLVEYMRRELEFQRAKRAKQDQDFQRFMVAALGPYGML